MPDVDLPAGATPADLAAAAAERLGWQPAGRLLRLEGFAGPWDRCLVSGKLLEEGVSLEEAGVKEGDAVTYVRVELLAEGWKVRGRRVPSVWAAARRGGGARGGAAGARLRGGGRRGIGLFCCWQRLRSRVWPAAGITMPHAPPEAPSFSN